MIGSYKTLAETIYQSRYTRNMIFPISTLFTNRNDGFALPLVALQFHTVSIQICLAALKDMIIVSSPDVKVINVENNAPITSNDLDANIVQENVYLDSVERDMLATTPLSYQIQNFNVQVHSKTVNKSTQWNLPYFANHPTPNIVVCAQRHVCKSKNQHFDFSGPHNKPLIAGSLGLSLNQNQRFEGSWSLFSEYYPYHRAARIPVLKDPKNQFGLLPFTSGDNTFSWQNSGTLNLSRIDHAEISCSNFSVKTDESVSLNIVQLYYNTLNISAGMGGLQYSN